jgi:hypothetical protein
VPNYARVRVNQLHSTWRRQSVGGRRPGGRRIEPVVLDAIFQALQRAAVCVDRRPLELELGRAHARLVT